MSVHYPDRLLAYVPPVQAWGQQFVITLILTKSHQHQEKVQETQGCTTDSSLEGQTFAIKPILTKSRRYLLSPDFRLQYDSNIQYVEEILVKSRRELIPSNPVLVVKYLKGYHACNNNHGDPAMTVETPLVSYYNNVTFPVYKMLQNTIQ